MLSIPHIMSYSLLFMTLYFEVFLLVTYLENRSDLKHERAGDSRTPSYFPTVSIIVPCWNEAKTLGRTMDSLMALEYPTDKLDIILVDDGSTDNTWETMQTFLSGRIRAFRKENGGKHTALNFGLTQSKDGVMSELVGCLDADSYVDSQALKNIALYFEEHPDVSAVTPSVQIWKPKNLLQTVQSVEYTWAVFLRKMLSYIGAIYITPGPFSIFRRAEVFDKIGNYRKAHQTEDMELAVRMQANHLIIGHAHRAFVYTSAPDTVRKLYKQRLRWTYGFINNTIDYRYMFFKKEYGNLGIFMLPIAVLSIFSTLFITGRSIFSIIKSISEQIIKIRTVGFHLPHYHIGFDWFYVNTQFFALLGVLALVGTVTILLISRKIAHGKPRFSMDLLYFMVIYAVIAPVWLLKALYNTVFSVTTHWR